MGLFQHVGAYPANVTLPDGTVALVQAGEQREFDVDDPGPAWAPVTDSDEPKPRKPRRAKAAKLAEQSPDTPPAETAASDSTEPDTTVPPKEAAS